MPPTDRTTNKDYAIFLIRDNKNNKIIDMTTESNKRNYKFSMLKNLKDKTEKKHPTHQLFKNSDTDNIIFDVLDTFNGTYIQALNYMTKLGDEYKIATTRTIDNDILAIQEQIKNNKTQLTKQDETHEEADEDEEAEEIEEEKPKPTKKTKQTKPPKVLDTPPILEVVEIAPPTNEKTKPIKKVIKKIPLIEPTQEEAEDDDFTNTISASLNEDINLRESIKKAIKTPINKKTTKAPPKLSVDYEEDEEIEPAPAPAPTPIKPVKESKAKLTKKNMLINECQKLASNYNDCNDELFKLKQSILLKQEELKTDYNYILDVLTPYKNSYVEKMMSI